jgi:hypothetical protein
MSNHQSTEQRCARERKALQEMLTLLQAGADLRRAKVRRLRRAIRSRTYENDLKLAVALERLFRHDDHGTI